MPRRALALALSVSAATLGAALAAAASRADDARVVEIVARRFQFTPNVVTLRKDEPVVLRVRSEDVVHGFFQRSLGIDTTVQPGRTTEVRITPHDPGRYAVICHHFCGAGHGNMKMTVVVE